MSGRAEGFTLLELVVTLAILALVLGVSVVGLASLRPPSATAAAGELAAARDSAIRTGTPVFARELLFLPDGRAIGPGVDPLTGVLRAGR